LTVFSCGVKIRQWKELEELKIDLILLNYVCDCLYTTSSFLHPKIKEIQSEHIIDAKEVKGSTIQTMKRNCWRRTSSKRNSNNIP